MTTWLPLATPTNFPAKGSMDPRHIKLRPDSSSEDDAIRKCIMKITDVFGCTAEVAVANYVNGVCEPTLGDFDLPTGIIGATSVCRDTNAVLGYENNQIKFWNKNFDTVYWDIALNGAAMDDGKDSWSAAADPTFNRKCHIKDC
ncbi:hypothetical protein N7481_006619 [Penicillium waksmanii]|uniref:uncharacterized protein n=1 Tax=Penicillium waksmanii TaxID=69791 RepID=UPI0025499451|nr:uncharacterized protein N7481_006619 [Penicillium waksmanii]KAJ5984520.1 hypothetical protein N7481_006619 [Penicillium waksmanii]